MRNIENPIAVLADIAKEAAVQAEQLQNTNADYRKRLDEAQGRINELESTVAELGVSLSVANSKLREQYTASDELVEQNTRMTPAAARYRWLRDTAADKVPLVDGRLLGGDKLDDYIDEELRK